MYKIYKRAPPKQNCIPLNKDEGVVRWGLNKDAILMTELQICSFFCLFNSLLFSITNSSLRASQASRASSSSSRISAPLSFTSRISGPPLHETGNICFIILYIQHDHDLHYRIQVRNIPEHCSIF